MCHCHHTCVHINSRRSTSMLKVLLHTALVFLTGGVWFVVLIVRALVKK